MEFEGTKFSLCNILVLGKVNSGKTSLANMLSNKSEEFDGRMFIVYDDPEFNFFNVRNEPRGIGIIDTVGLSEDVNAAISYLDSLKNYFNDKKIQIGLVVYCVQNNKKKAIDDRLLTEIILCFSSINRVAPSPIIITHFSNRSIKPTKESVGSLFNTLKNNKILFTWCDLKLDEEVESIYSWIIASRGALKVKELMFDQVKSKFEMSWIEPKEDNNVTVPKYPGKLTREEVANIFKIADETYEIIDRKEADGYPESNPVDEWKDFLFEKLVTALRSSGVLRLSDKK